MNDMSAILRKAQKHLGLDPLIPYLPKKYGKDEWAKWVATRTLDTFSRYFPWKVQFHVTKDVPKRNGWYIIDEEKYFGAEGILLGIQDIDWSDFSQRNASLSQIGSNGLFLDMYGLNFYPEDIMALQGRADLMSTTNYNNVFIDTQPPNKFRLTSIANSDILTLNDFCITLIMKHPDTLHTIEPTKMEIFENLVFADIAGFLYKNLKYWDQMETVFATIDLKLSDLEREADNRVQIVEELKNSYVTPQNKNIPYMITI